MFNYDYYLSIGRNAINPGFAGDNSLVTVLGQNTDVDTGTVPEDVIPQGGVYTFLAAASNVEVVSDNANDTSAGTGLRTVLIRGLDANYDPVQTIVSLNGLTPVVASIPFYRINALIGLTGGASEFNLGNITVRVQGGGATVSYMAAQFGLAAQAVYTIPAGFSAFVSYLSCAIRRSVGTDYAEFEVQYKTPGGVWLTAAAMAPMTQGQSRIEVHPQIPVYVPQKADIRVRVVAVSASNSLLSCAVQATLIRNL